MHQKSLILFLIAFILFENIATSSSAHSSSKYDITKTLQDSIQSTIYPIIANVWKILSCRKNEPHDLTFTSEIENKTFVGDFYSTFRECAPFKVHKDFINDEVVVTIDEYKVENTGWITETSNPKRKYFSNHLVNYPVHSVFKSNGSLVTVSHKKRDAFALNFFYDMGKAKSLTEKLLKHFILDHTWNQLVESIYTLIRKFVADLNNATRTIFTSNHTALLSSEQQYYYLIPNVSLICFDLRNIKIKGLNNFHSLKINNEETFCTLKIRNIRGKLILDYRSDVEAPMKLNFVAHNMTISFNSSERDVNVEMKKYRVYRKRKNTTLTDVQSAQIIQRVESAIASSLMPSREVWWTKDQLSRNCSKESFGGEIVIAMLQHTDLDTKKKALNKWIPFRDSRITIDEP